MDELRPMSVIDLKKRFLKLLVHLRNKGFSYPYEIVFELFPKHFNMAPLSEEEKQKRTIIVDELLRDGYIELIPGKQKSYTPTEKGFDIAVKNMEEMKIQHVDLNDLLTPRYDLLKKIRRNYFIGDFESAIFNAYKLLEEKVRKKTQQPSSVHGVKLMDIAFKPKEGLLKHPRVETTSEQEGIHFLMRGSISFFKNPSSHKTVDWSDPNISAHIIAFAKFLLDLIDECKLADSKQ